MTAGQLLQMLERIASEHRGKVLASIMRNSHMNDLTQTECQLLGRDPILFQRVADAVLVDFINQVARNQGGDLGLKVEHIRKPHGAA